jgi:hypothetical protein
MTVQATGRPDLVTIGFVEIPGSVRPFDLLEATARIKLMIEVAREGLVPQADA